MKNIESFLRENNAAYAKMIIEAQDLNLKPYILESAKGVKGYYSDKEKGIISYLDNKDGGMVEFVWGNAEIPKNKDEYRVGIFEYSDNHCASIWFNYYGCGPIIQIDILPDKIDFKYSHLDWYRNSDGNLDYKCDGQICHNGLSYSKKDGTTLKTPNGTNIYPISFIQSIDYIMDVMVEPLYVNVIAYLTNSIKDEECRLKVRQCAKDNFKLIEPVLRDAISKIYVRSWKERLANIKNTKTSTAMERTIGCIIENEGCEFVNCDVKNKEIYYQNDEIIVTAYDINANHSSMDIRFRDKKENSINIVEDRDTTLPSLCIKMNCKNGESCSISFDNSYCDQIVFDTLDGRTIICRRNIDGNLYWIDGRNSSLVNFIDCDVKDFVDKVHEEMSRGVNNPEFERLFEIIKPALIQNVLDFKISYIKRLYSYIDRNNEEIAAIETGAREYDDEESRKRDLTTLYVYRCGYEQYIEIMQDNICDEFYTPNNEKK